MLFDPRWQKPDDKVSEHLLRAAAYVEEHGWCQGALSNLSGEVCIVGAIMKTCDGAPNGAAIWRLQIHLPEGAAWWNDRVCQSKEQAVAALRAAAYRKRSSQNDAHGGPGADVSYRDM